MNTYLWLSTEESSFRDLNFGLSISTNIASYHISISLKIELMVFCFKVVNGAHRNNIPFSEMTMYERQNSLHFCVCICTCTYLIKTKCKGKPAAESKFWKDILEDGKFINTDYSAEKGRIQPMPEGRKNYPSGKSPRNSEPISNTCKESKQGPRAILGN